MVATANHGAVLHGAGDLRVEPLPLPVPRGAEVLVELQVVGICGSDVHYYERGGIGPFVVRQPQVLGHEPFGVIAAVGPQVRRHRAGQRVAVEPGLPCGRCRECRSGAYNLCPDVAFLGNPPADPAGVSAGGALARYLAVHEDFAHPVPDAVSDEAGALIEPLAVALFAARRARIGPASKVLITGAGPIGLIAAQVARAAGATGIAVTDVRDEPLAHARRLGASEILNVAREPLRVREFQPDVLLECSGSPAAMAGGIGALGPSGIAVLVGVGPEEAALPVAAIRRRELTVTAIFRYAGVFPDAIALAASGGLDLESLVTDRIPLEQAPEAFRAAAARRNGGADAATAVKTLVDVTVATTGQQPGGGAAGAGPATRGRNGAA